MTVWHTSNNVMRDSGQSTVRSRTFSIPINLKSCKINTIYTFFINGINMGYACKPFGGVLGGNLISDNGGNLNFQVLFDQRHNSGLIGNSPSVNQVLDSKMKCEVIDPTGLTTIFYIPVVLKPTQ